MPTTWPDIETKVDVVDAKVDELSIADIEPTSSYTWIDQGDYDVEFTDTSSILNPTAIVPNAEIAAWFWDFGDGQGVVEKLNSNPFLYTFPATGNYTVQLFVATNYGWQHISSQVVAVAVTVDAAFTWQQINFDPPVIEFTDTSDAGVNSIVDRIWNFGDGEEEVRPRGDFDPFTHEYPLVSTDYAVLLSIVDDLGNTTSKERTVSVVYDPSVINALFTVEQIAFSPPVIRVTDQSSSDPNPIISRKWDFGDNTDEVEQGANSGPFNHTYESAGIYQIRLRVTNSAGEFHEYTASIAVVVINLPPKAFYTAQVQNQGGYRFTDLSSDPEDDLVQWDWDYGDGGTDVFSISTNPVHVYTANGTYVISLTVTDGGGLTHTQPGQITVDNISEDPADPIPRFFFEETADPKEYQFYDDSLDPNGVITNWNWNWGDGLDNDYGVSTDPTHTYAKDGDYDVILTVTGAGGVLYSITHLVIVDSGVDLTTPPSAEFIVNSCIVSGTDIEASFLGTSTPGTDRDGNPVAIVAWEWDFGDGTVLPKGPEQNPQHTYSP